MNKRMYSLNAKCPKCRKWLMLSSVNDYSLTCPNCNEDFYGNENLEICGDWFEITIVMDFYEYKEMLESIKENFKDACFSGYSIMEVCDIGFDHIPNSERVKDIIKFFNLEDDEKKWSEKYDTVFNS